MLAQIGVSGVPNGPNFEFGAWRPIWRVWGQRVGRSECVCFLIRD